MLRKSSAGFSLLEAMIAAGVLGGIALFSVGLLKNGMTGQKTMLATDDARQLTDQAAATLSNAAACTATFTGRDPAAGFSVNSIVAADGSVILQAGKTYNSNLTLESISVGGPGTDPRTSLVKYASSGSNGGTSTGLALVLLNWQKKAMTNGPSALERYFFISVSLGPLGRIQSCIAAGNGLNDGIWSRNQGNLSEIYYSGGNVGVGTTDPAVALDVAGSVRPGNSGVSKGGTCSPEGSFGYDLGSHAPMYCNDKGTWSIFGYTGHLFSCSCTSENTYQLDNVLFNYDKQAAGECCGYTPGSMACHTKNGVGGGYGAWTCNQIQ